MQVCEHVAIIVSVKESLDVKKLCLSHLRSLLYAADICVGEVANLDNL